MIALLILSLLLLALGAFFVVSYWIQYRGWWRYVSWRFSREWIDSRAFVDQRYRRNVQ